MSTNAILALIFGILFGVLLLFVLYCKFVKKGQKSVVTHTEEEKTKLVDAEVREIDDMLDKLQVPDISDKDSNSLTESEVDKLIKSHKLGLMD